MKRNSRNNTAFLFLVIFCVLLLIDIVLHITYLVKLSGFENTVNNAVTAVVNVQSPDNVSGELSTQDNKSPYSDLGKKVFIGNSILNGVADYGYLANEKIISKIGINIDTIRNSEFMTQNGTVYCITALQAEEPDSVFIMLGSNEVGWMSIDSMIEKYRQLFADIRSINPDMKIFIFSISHVEPKYTEKDPDINNTKIEEWNNSLHAMADEENVGYVDLDGTFTAEDGTMVDEYVEPDGMHWNNSGCMAFENYLKELQII